MYVCVHEMIRAWTNVVHSNTQMFEGKFKSMFTCDLYLINAHTHTQQKTS